MSDNAKARFVRIDGELFQRQADGTLMPVESKTDWSRLAAMTEQEIEKNAETDLDSLPYSDEEWQNVPMVRPRKISITIRLDEDILDFFQKKHGKYQTAINTALRKAMAG